MADYSRPASGFRFKFGGLKTNSPADAMEPGKYPMAVNVRETEDSSLTTRPGLEELFETTMNQAVTDIKAYTRLNSDTKPRFLARTEGGDFYLDNGTNLGPIVVRPDGKQGVSMIPFRPAQSPTPYMYVATGVGFKKYSAPDSLDNVVQSKVGIAEPQAPPDASVWQQTYSPIGQPNGGSYTPGGNAGAVTIGSRVSDVIQGVFQDPIGGKLSTLQVGGGGAGAPLAPGVYLGGPVNLFVFPKDPSFAGGFPWTFPLDVGEATFSFNGNSLNVNPSQFNGTEDPDVRPPKWATINSSGSITGYQTLTGIGENQAMVFTVQLFVSAPGIYNLEIDHDDGIIFAIQGAKFLSGPLSDPINHDKTAVQGYKFTNATVAGINQSGYHKDVFSIQFPSAGFYPMEIDWAQWVNALSMNVFSNGQRLHLGGPPANASNYQRFMAIRTQTPAQPPNTAPPLEIQDVFPPLPASVDIQAIFYYSGTTGDCTVVPARMAPAPGTEGMSLYSQNLLAGIRRGSLVKIGDEVCMVRSTTNGPEGVICFDTNTVAAHTEADQLSGALGIQVLGSYVPTAGDTLSSADVEFSVTTGISTVTSPVSSTPFVYFGQSFQSEDYVHFSVNITNLANINEIKILFDVSDGSFTRDFYFFTVRPSDIAAGVQNQLTQLGVAQLVAQRAAIDEERSAAAGNQGTTHSSLQTNAGDSQWSEIMFPISAFTRVGNNQGASLQNVAAMQLLVNTSGLATIKWNSTSVRGGYQPDVGDSGAPYLYRIRPRSRATGAKGNPSPIMRYPVNPRRELVVLQLPGPPDAQVDTWDIFRYGGKILSWRFIGATPATSLTFNDNYGDDVAAKGELLEDDNYEPWPSIDVPLQAVASLVCGTVAIITVPAGANNIERYLPGNFVQIGSVNVYKLWRRPTLVAVGQYMLLLTENAGFQTNVQCSIYEPVMAAQQLPYMWGPDANGVVFAVGDPLRAGTFSFSKSNDLDSAPEKNNIEITSPSEPLLGGEIANGLSYVASSERWWALYFQPGNPLQLFNPVPQPVTRGLVAPFGHCSDGKAIYFWAKDGIYSTSDGSLTDADLHNIFPHEGVPGRDYTYNGQTIPAPDYGRAGTFRLAKVNEYLYATYQDSAGHYRQLVMNLRTKAWRVDEYSQEVSVVYHPEQPAGSLYSTNATPPTPQLYPQAIFGLNGLVATQTDLTNDIDAPITATVSTIEWDGGDLRAGKQWGDFFIDMKPASATVEVQARSFDNGVGLAQVVIQEATRRQSVMSLGGGFLADFLGLGFRWIDNFDLQTQATTLYSWQPSFIPKQETTSDRFSDWFPVRPGGKAGYVQGVLLHADTTNLPKVIQVRDADTLTLHTMTPVVKHNGESTLAYSFDVPFVAHLVRIEPQDTVPWRFFDAIWVAEDTPETARVWQAQPTSFGQTGYFHIPHITAAYSATQPVTLEISVQNGDGQSPAPIVFPATGGVMQKIFRMLTFNKGQLYTFKASSAETFQFFLPDFEIFVGPWGRSGEYLNVHSLGGNKGDKAEI